MAILFVLLAGQATPVRGWGFEAHRIVVDNARPLLPPALRSFFDARAGELRRATLEPDGRLRGERGMAETVGHFLDLDLLDHYPFRGIPLGWEAAVERFGPERMENAGRLPWRVEEVQAILTGEMRSGDWDAALRHAAWLAHYVADATQPLHGTENYDGQQSCNRGIHEAFERRLIERDPDRYRRAALRLQGRAVHLERPAGEVFRLLVEGYPLNRAILAADAEAVRRVKRADGEYFEVLEKRLREPVERQLAAAGTAVASFWLTAWIDAGRVEPPR